MRRRTNRSPRSSAGTRGSRSLAGGLSLLPLVFAKLFDPHVGGWIGALLAFALGVRRKRQGRLGRCRFRRGRGLVSTAASETDAADTQSETGVPSDDSKHREIGLHCCWPRRSGVFGSLMCAACTQGTAEAFYSDEALRFRYSTARKSDTKLICMNDANAKAGLDVSVFAGGGVSSPPQPVRPTQPIPRARQAFLATIRSIVRSGSTAVGRDARACLGA
jgi:hypothetical protein